MAISLRADRAVFRFSGPEAHRLLNDVLTGIMPIAFGLLAIRLVQAARPVLRPRRGATPPS